MPGVYAPRMHRGKCGCFVLHCDRNYLSFLLLICQLALVAEMSHHLLRWPKCLLLIFDLRTTTYFTGTVNFFLKRAPLGRVSGTNYYTIRHQMFIFCKSQAVVHVWTVWVAFFIVSARFEFLFRHVPFVYERFRRRQSDDFAWNLSVLSNLR